MQLLREEADRNTTTSDGTLLNISLCDWWVDADARDLVLEQKKISISEANRAFKLTDKTGMVRLTLRAFLDLDLVSDEADEEYYFEQLDVDQSRALGWDEFRMLSTDADVETLAGIDDIPIPASCRPSPHGMQHGSLRSIHVHGSTSPLGLPAHHRCNVLLRCGGLFFPLHPRYQRS